MSDSLRLHVESITKLPTIPVIAQKILSFVEDDLSSANQLEKIIENDPAISAKILNVANSAFYGFRTPARTLENAIVRLGFNTVKNIALGISLMTVLDSGRNKMALDYQRIFNHSVSVGLLANLLAKSLRLEIADEVLINGILHDIGLLILSRYFPETYFSVLQSFDGEKSLMEAEKEIFNFTHADIGEWLAEKWELPGTILNTVLYHHTPSLAKEDLPYIAVVHIADLITTRNILSVTERCPNYSLDPLCLEVLGMSEGDFEKLETQVKEGMFLNALFEI